MKRSPPSTPASAQEWIDFNAWADAHAVPQDPEEDWLYLWELWQAACRAKITALLPKFRHLLETA